MRTFVEAPSVFWASLGRLPSDKCRTYAVEYPPPTVPSSGRIGFERASSGRFTVFVDPADSATGLGTPLDSLLLTGTQTFDSIEQLGNFFDTDVRQAYESAGIRLHVRNRRSPLPGRSPGVWLDADRLAQHLAARLVGQQTAIARLCTEVCIHVAKVGPLRPSSNLLLGPTGVGKTLAAEQLVDALNCELGDETYRWVKVNCGELADSMQISRVLGAPPGYIGHDEGSELVETLRAGPTVLLFDEIEKAHPDFFHKVLLALLDRGEISLPRIEREESRTVQAPETIIIFTSNLPIPATGLLGSEKETRQSLRSAGFPAELVGRIGAIISFAPLEYQDRRHATALALEQVLGEFGLELLDVDPTVVDRIIAYSDAESGARDLSHTTRRMFGAGFAQASAWGANRVRIDAHFRIYPVETA
jgi:hypothetical protein